VGRGETTAWKKPKYEKKKWYKNDPESLKKLKKELESMLGRKQDSIKS